MAFKKLKEREKLSTYACKSQYITLDKIPTWKDQTKVDSAVHKAAGKALYCECQSIGELKVGDAKISGGYKLPSKFVIHTALPLDYDRKRLEECYLNSFAVAVEKGVRSVAFPSLCTKYLGYPSYEFAHLALRTVRNFLEENGSSVDLVAFCLFLHADVQIHEDLMKFYFPI
ncbi:hypothetical protein JTE90_021977 [Oedothorax gibbosus]|uniref:Macro domain-containing protein n=1 Tax=Oedothorax gibbosus TaxID=931172 RepID=A0AAV6U149_9ARAC|nr:hypothetical protein JTE90_021977 [Oedothorax gibbosus]